MNNTNFTKDNYRWPLLLVNNHKTIKGEKKGIKTYIMYMSSHKQNSKGVNLCPMASAGCAEACLFKSGMGGLYSNVEQGRINKSEFYLNDRIGFLDYLMKEITKIVKRHKTHKNYVDFIPVFRLNGTTDIRWEKQKASNGLTILEAFPDYQFYDYTKIPARMFMDMPANYHLTFSRSETNDDDVMKALSAGKNVAVVFDKVPETWRGYPVIDADETDLRFMDPENVIVGLKYKNVTSKGFDNKATIAKNEFVINSSVQ